MIVWKVKVYSRNFINDFSAKLKNIIGGRLKTYENMINTGIKECIDDLNESYPNTTNIKLQITEFKDASIAVIAYGEQHNN